MEDAAEIIFLPKIIPAETEPPTDISVSDIVVLFCSVLEMAREKLSAAQFAELAEYYICSRTKRPM